MPDIEIYICPKCNKDLIKKEVVYGLPDPTLKENEDVILAGCCVPEYPLRFAYECPSCKMPYVITKDNKLKIMEGMEESED